MFSKFTILQSKKIKEFIQAVKDHDQLKTREILDNHKIPSVIINQAISDALANHHPLLAIEILETRDNEWFKKKLEKHVKQQLFKSEFLSKVIIADNLTVFSLLLNHDAVFTAEHFIKAVRCDRQTIATRIIFHFLDKNLANFKICQEFLTEAAIVFSQECFENILYTYREHANRYDLRLILFGIAIQHKNVVLLLNLLHRFNYDLTAKSAGTYEETPLALACSLGNVRIVNVLINHGNLSILDKNDSNALTGMPIHIAERARNFDIVNYFLTFANVCEPNEEGDTALILAIEYMLYELVIKLLNTSNPNVNHVNKHNETALSVAVNKFSCTRTIRALLAAGALPNHANAEGDTPLIKSVRFIQPGVVETLLKSEIDLDIENHQRETALIIAHRQSETAKGKEKKFAENIYKALIQYRNQNCVSSPTDKGKQSADSDDDLELSSETSFSRSSW